MKTVVDLQKGIAYGYGKAREFKAHSSERQSINRTISPLVKTAVQNQSRKTPTSECLATSFPSGVSSQPQTAEGVQSGLALTQYRENDFPPSSKPQDYQADKSGLSVTPSCGAGGHQSPQKLRLKRPTDTSNFRSRSISAPISEESNHNPTNSRNCANRASKSGDYSHEEFLSRCGVDFLGN